MEMQMAAEPDRPDLTQAQREALARLLNTAFVLMRAPGYKYYWDKPEDWNDLARVQAAVDASVAMAEALHNIPLFLYRGHFNFALQKNIMASYIDACPDLAGLILDLEEIEAMGERGGSHYQKVGD
jgi:hypothetical protein